MPCCSTIACRLCAYRHINKHSCCWNCKNSFSNSTDFIVLIKYRELIQDLLKGTRLASEVRCELESRREKFKTFRETKREEFARYVVNEDGEHIDQDLTTETRPKNDHERIALSKKRFRNMTNFDPETNLSFHGFKRHKRAGRPNRNKVNIRSFELREGTMNPRPGYVKQTYFSTPPPPPSVQSPPVSIHKLPENVKEIMLKNLKERFGDNYTSQDKREMKSFCKHYTEGYLETSKLVSLYNSNNNNGRMMSQEKLDEVLACERHLSGYSEYYGDVSEKLMCPDCNEQHGF